MNSSRQIYLHPGYGKTGTTTLQREFFGPLGKMGHLHYFGMFQSESDRRNERAFFDDLTSAMYVTSDRFVELVPKLKQSLAECLAHIDPGVPSLLSNEHFLLSTYSSRLRGVTIEAAETARRLGVIFNDYQVSLIIGLRHQAELIHSMFVETASRSEHANLGYFRTLDEYIEKCLNEQHLFSKMYDFSACIQQYQRAFENPRIHIYLFEDFRKDQAAVLSRILEFLDLPAPELLGVFQLPLRDMNKKDKSLDGVRIQRQSALHRIIRRSPALSTMLYRLKSAPTLTVVNRLFKQRFVVPYLDQKKRDAISSHFDSVNWELSAKQPLFAKALEAAGYFQSNRSLVVDASVMPQTT